MEDSMSAGQPGYNEATSATYALRVMVVTMTMFVLFLCCAVRIMHVRLTFHVVRTRVSD